MLGALTVSLVVLTSSVERLSVRAPPPPPVDPALQKLIEKYGAIRTAVCNNAVAKVPTPDASDSAAFMTSYQGYLGNNSEDAVMAAAQKLLVQNGPVDQFLSLPDTSTDANGLDAMMAKCAVMTSAEIGVGGSPKSEFDDNMNTLEPPSLKHGGPPPPANLLAKFAVQGAAQEALVDQLLTDYTLMRDMLVAGGAIGGYYGEAMGIWTNITNASKPLRDALPVAADMPWDDRSPENVLKRLALGIAVGLAIPIQKRYQNTSKFVDPVARYLHFEKHYYAGDLDPAFPVLTAFELSHTMDSDGGDDEFIWLRTTLANFRPDTIAMSYHWRYAESVHTDVQYGDSQCVHFPGVCTGRFSDIPVGGDVCGGRAFWGRFVRKGFGLPTWGATEHAHAAMSTWTPTGWTVLLGAPWPDCWWGNRGGQDWYLETQARENLTEFQKVLRGSWVSLAKQEDPVDMHWSSAGYSPSNGKGGFWAALMLYKKKIVAKESPPANRTIPPAQSGIVNKVDALLARSTQPPTPPVPPSTAPDGTITIMAASYTSKNRSAPVNVIRSFDEGTQLISNGCTSSVGPPCFEPASSSVTYTFTAATAGTFYFNANFSTYHMNQYLYLSVNGAKPVEIGVFYTNGWWNQTQPLEVTLVQGSNTLVFTTTSGRDVAYKAFTLSPKKPVVPEPNPAYKPIPAPPSPPPGSYIEIPADTTCEKQGIKPVSEADCSHACLALGFKSTGDRARPNMSGCFVMTTGEYAGNCNFNTNTSATCTPPCTLYGVITRALCTRQ